MHPRNILNKVSVDDICEMYDNGMSARDIAVLFDCSVKTIYRHLENHPKRSKGGIIAASIPSSEINKRSDEVAATPDVLAVKNEQNACVVLESCDIRLAGTVGTYSINTKAGEIVAMFGEDKVSIPMGMVNAVVEELKAVGRCEMSFDMGNAMW